MLRKYRVQCEPVERAHGCARTNLIALARTVHTRIYLPSVCADSMTCEHNATCMLSLFGTPRLHPYGVIHQHV